MPSVSLVVLRQLLVMALLIAVGWLVARRGVLTPAGNAQLSAVLTGWVIPSVIFNAFITLDASVEGLRLLGQTLALMLFSYCLSISTALILFGKKTAENSMRRAGTVFTNNGFFGIPVVQALFGASGVFYASIAVLCNNLLLWTWGAAQFDVKRRVSLKGVLAQPAAKAAAAGVVVYLVRLTAGPALAQSALISTFTGPVGTALASFTALNTPLAMLVTGVNIHAAGFKVKDSLRTALPMVGLRQMLLPVVLLCLTFWLPLPKDLIFSVYVLACCPMALLISVLSQRYGAPAQVQQRATHMVVLGTLLSLITVPLMVALGTLLVPM